MEKLQMGIGLDRERCKNLMHSLETAVDNDAYYLIQELNEDLQSAIESLLADIREKYGK